MTSANSTGISMSEALSYDLMGNINTLNRDGAGARQYNYTGNRLSSVDNVTGAYAYDANGNATTDGRNGATIAYNYLNLPQTVVKGGITIGYTYNSMGEKLSRNTNGNVRNYVDGIEYNGNTIDIIHTEEGIARNNGGTYSYEYNLTDNLGNVRASFYRNPTSGALEVLQRDDYYAFGLRKSSQFGNNKYLYNGKELQEELNEYDYGARFYDPIIGRWNVTDPLAEKGRRFSPYVYGNNNPIRFVDPDGMENEDWVMGKDKKPYWDNKATSQATTKKGETYLGKSVQYETKEGYGISLNPDKSWNHTLYSVSGIDKVPYNETFGALQDGIRQAQPMLDMAEGVATGTAMIAGGEVAGGEAAGSYLLGQAARKADFLTSLAEQPAPKLLNQFNSVESLLGNAVLNATKKGALQGFVKGDGSAIFNAISRGGTKLESGAVEMPNGTTIFNHFSTKTGQYTIDINKAAEIFKIRVNP